MAFLRTDASSFPIRPLITAMKASVGSSAFTWTKVSRLERLCRAAFTPAAEEEETEVNGGGPAVNVNEFQ